MIERDPRDPPLLNHVHEFDRICGILLSVVEIHYPTKLSTVKETLNKVVDYAYSNFLHQVVELNPNNENKAARLTIRALRDCLSKWKSRIRALKATI